MSAPQSLGIFAINLDRSADRWQALSQAFGGLAYPLRRVPALDARTQQQEVLAVRGLSLALPPSGLGYSVVREREYLLVQEACFASHLVGLRQFLATDLDLALMLEDDALPRPALEPVLDAILRCPASVDIIKLEGMRHAGRRLAVPVAAVGPARLVRSLRPSSGSAAYLVTRAAAARMIERAGQLLLPFDDYLSNPRLTGCDTCHVAPYPIVQADVPSLIGQSYDRQTLRRRRGPGAFARQAGYRLRLRLALWASALGKGGIPRNFDW